MASHSFERFCSLWLTRVKGAFVIENLPIRFTREKTSKYSPGTGTTDIDLISFDPSNGGELSLNECKSNIHSTFLRASKERLLRQLEAQAGLADLLPFAAHVKIIKKRVFALKLAPGVRKDVPPDVEVIEGADFEHKVLDALIEKIGEDPWIDPRDDVLGSLRILWHFGCLDRRYYLKRARAILAENPTITAGTLRDWLGLVSHKTPFAKSLLAEIKAHS